MARIPPKADSNWIPAFQGRYETWFREAKPLSEAHQYGAAFKTYPFVSFDQTPWSPVRVSLPEARLGVVSTAGLYRKDIDFPFTDNPEGDPRIIELPSEVDHKNLDTAHPHIPQEPVRADVNVALPLVHLRALVGERRIGEIGPRIFSLIGYRTRADEVAVETATTIAAAMAEDRVTLALIVPV